MPDPAVRRMTRISFARIIQQIQCIDGESRDQPLFSQCGIGAAAATVTKIHGSRISDSPKSDFRCPCFVEKKQRIIFWDAASASRVRRPSARRPRRASSAILASSASIRAASALFSARAFTAMSRTASNSSRCTTSIELRSRLGLRLERRLDLAANALRRARGIGHQLGEFIENAVGSGGRHGKPRSVSFEVMGVSGECKRKLDRAAPVRLDPAKPLPHGPRRILTAGDLA